MISFFREKDENKPISFASLQMKKSPRNYKKWIIVAILLALALFGLYINKYQQLVNEGSYLADEHCIKINPLIINRKKAYLDQYNLLMASATNSANLQDYYASIDKYLKESKTYIKEEVIWLAKDKKFIDSGLFNLLMPSYIKEGSNYQYQMYEAEYKSSLYILQAFEEKGQTDKQLELSNKSVEEVSKSRVAGEKYQGVWKDNEGKTDWRFNFVKVPPTTCPKENNDFPEIPDMFAPSISVPDGETKS